ncbi:MAG TPA: phosphate ABC transporter permease subunit PstC [Candidatus Limnocylindria bacterium]|nr:phosphate ABC transporter permease subunit PstC [Candidatus Limnocylindria bacterium]
MGGALIARLGISDLRGDPGRRRREAAIRLGFQAAALLSVVISAAIILTLVGEAWSFVSQVDPVRLIDRGWFPRRDMYGIPTIVAGTLSIAGIAMLVAAPLGLGSAMYLSEYAGPRARSMLKPALEVLAGIPSVVLGYFALQVLSPTVVDPLCIGPTDPYTMAAAGIAVGILVTPLVASVAEDAMHAVPTSLREAAYGLGARRRTASLRVVVPAAVSGIVAGLILGMSRAIGETMVVAIAAGGLGGSLFSLDPCGPGQTMTAAMTALATGSDQVRGASLAFPSLFFVGLLLFAFTLGLNLVANRVVRRMRERY